MAQMPKIESRSEGKVCLGPPVDHHAKLSYDQRYLDAFSALINITSSPCAAVVGDEATGEYYYAYNTNKAQLLQKSKPAFGKLIPIIIHDLNTRHTEALLGKYLVFSQNALEILKEVTSCTLDETLFYKGIHSLLVRITDLKAHIFKYKFTRTTVKITNEETLANIEGYKENAAKVKLFDKNSSDFTETREELVTIARKANAEKQKISKAKAAFNETLNDLIQSNNIATAIDLASGDEIIMSGTEKAALIKKLHIVSGADENLLAIAREYRELVASEASKSESKDLFFAHESRSPMKHLLRPIQDVEKLVRYLTIKGIKITDFTQITPTDVPDGITKHCEEILHETFPDQEFVGVSHLCCASCNKALPPEKHRGDSRIAFIGTTHFDSLVEAAMAEGEGAVGDDTSTMYRTISHDPEIWNPLSLLMGGEMEPAKFAEVAA